MIGSVTLGTRGTGDVLVLGLFKGEKLDKASAGLDPSGAAAAATTRPEATGETGTVLHAFPGEGAKKSAYSRVMVVGLGDAGTLDAARLRNVGAAIVRGADAAKAGSVHLGVFSAIGQAKKAPEVFDAACALGEGMGLRTWDGRMYAGSATKRDKAGALRVHAEDAPARAGLARGLGLAESANMTRSLSQTPPNIATTDAMAEACVRLARKHRSLKCTVMKGEALERERMAGLVNVGKASENPPQLVRLEYTPEGGGGSRRAKPIVLVGKTITYDTGGLSLKINNGMKGMKRDKDGGCAVIGAMHAIATVIRPRQRVVALLAIAENSISDEAYRPDDVITYRNGVTVEVTNTDAEGRLVLADALCWACEKEDPACVVDLATLTGGVVVALGSTYAGMFCEDDKLRARVERASAASGERVWRLPMHDEYRAMMKSPVADIVNSAPVREAHPIQGAAFLSYFVKDSIPWCHLDIAGVHATEKDSGPYVAGPTGWGARLLAEFVDD
jgi:leucyl aminopeptidase